MRQKNPEYMAEIEAFVDEFFSSQRRSPSIREIAGNVSLGRNAVHRYLREMDERGMIQYDGRQIRTRKIQAAVAEHTSTGILGSIPCGPLSMEEECVEEYVDLPTRLFGKGKLFLLHASGDSMTGAGIDDGDLVLIRQQEEAQNGDIVVAYVEGEGNTLKRYIKYGKTVFLHPENPKYTDIPLKDCKIQGIAVSVIKMIGCPS